MGYEVNVTVVSGNLTRDPELADLGSSTICEFGLAHNERYKTSDGEWKDRPNFFDVKIWGAQGDRFAEHAHKGMHVTVSGRLTQRSWEDRDGNKRSKVEITANDLIYDTRGSTEKAASQEKDNRFGPGNRREDNFRDVDFGTDELPF